MNIVLYEKTRKEILRYYSKVGLEGSAGMKLSNFEEFVEDVIVKRGKKYYMDGHVKKTDETAQDRYEINIVGSDDYSVMILLDDNNQIIDTTCDCPYDWGNYCKHQVAAFFALRENRDANLNKMDKQQKPASKKEPDLETILTTFSKAELVKMIVNYTDDYPDIEKQIRYEHVPAKDEIITSRKLIRKYINRYKHRGFIKWRDVSNALQGAEMTLKKVDEKIAQNDIKTATLLCQTVLSIVVDMIQYSDDSGGEVGWVIDNSMKKINEAILFGIDTIEDGLKQNLFEILLKEASHQRYDGWPDWRLDLLKSCIPLCDTDNRRNKMEYHLNERLEAVRGDTWGGDYNKQGLKLIQYELIQHFDDEKKANQFMNEHIEYSDFRKMAIEHLLENGEYLEAMNISVEGQKQHQAYPGLVTQWKEYELQAYEGLGDVAKQRELLLYFICENKYNYYPQLKKLYSETEWLVVLEDIFKTFESQHYSPYAYLEIAIKENRKDKIIRYCECNPSAIKDLYPHLIDKYISEVSRLFENYIREEASFARDRKKYRAVCNIIKTYKKVCGAEDAQAIIDELKKENDRRPAFLDELGKMK